MIARLRGELIYKGIDSIVIDVGGVGYEATVSLRALQALPPAGDQATVHVVTHVREDALQLFGFQDAADKAMFQRLVSVSGIGPKLAINAFSLMSAEELQAAILAADIKALSGISGVGKKTAQRIVLELGERVRALDLGGGTGAARATPAGVLADLRQALEGLGFGPKQIEPVCDALAGPAGKGVAIEDLLRQALGLLRS